MEKIWFTSNLFIGRTGIVEDRGFDDVADMDSYIIKKWNELIKEDDAVYVLGNLAWDPIRLQDFITNANGQINCLIGEYDDAVIESVMNFDNLNIIPDQIHSFEEMGAVISYWPLKQWPGKENGSIHLYGKGDVKNELKESGNFINVSAGIWDLTPVNMKNLVDFIAEIKEAK